MGRLPLENIKIIDLSVALAGPFGSQLLADYGANVIKIEPPGKGDMMRELGPPFIGGESYYFMMTNRNKRSMTLNLRSEKGLEIFRKLASNADVVLENYRPGVKKRLKIDYEDLKDDNPGLIYASISGFGQTGPYAERAGFDPIAQGMAGLSSVTGWKHTGPVRVGVAIGDTLAAIFITYGILTALFEREKSGVGQRVETSLLESLVGVLGFQAAKYFGANVRPEAQGNDHAMISPFGTFKAKGGYINIAAGNQGMWERLAKAVGLEHLIDDGRFLTNSDRVGNRSELTNLLEEKLAEKTVREWQAVLDDAGVANGPILYIDEVFKDPQVLNQQMILETEHPTAGLIKTLGFPAKLDRTPGAIRMPSPLLGQHTDEILRELDYSPEQIKVFREEGIV